MDKQENRENYIDHLDVFIKLVKLTPEFLTLLERHPIFTKYMTSIKKLSEDHQLIVVLLELTRERSSCQAVIDMLTECGQIVAAKELNKFNISPGLWALTDDIQLPVTTCFAPKEDLSNSYNLVKECRGKFILINNMEKPDLQLQGSVGLKNETTRFKHLFERLNFSVEVISDVSADGLRKALIDIRNNGSLANSEAFGLMVISHGKDEKIYGSDACDLINQIGLGTTNENDKQALDKIDKDSLAIDDIISIFSENNCHHLKSKPKLFFFICCRLTEDSVPDNNYEGAIKMTKKSQHGNASMDTFVAYSCARGHKTFYNPSTGYTFFGQALSHSISQYACTETLSGIMSRTQTRLLEIYNNMKLIGIDGSFATEVISYAMNKQLYFNPGYPFKKISYDKRPNVQLDQQTKDQRCSMEM